MNKKRLSDNEDKIRKIRIIEPEYEAILALYEARTELGMSQQELSELSGIRQSNISRIENGTCSPSIRTISALALAMGKKLEIKIK
ncbi:MAG: helix-turn-helix transcriptional regulator [Erysipelotrichaceae bacterium]|nr:helix-turn-helix transcriptional regulator [Erysipelotrichaceae bacterium]